jgi:hypothetical protein
MARMARIETDVQNAQTKQQSYKDDISEMARNIIVHSDNYGYISDDPQLAYEFALEDFFDSNFHS